MRKATLKDIAQEAGVSSCLASKVLNGKKEGVWASSGTKAKILAAAEKLDYKPNISARRLAGGRKDSIGIFLDRFSDFKSSFMTMALQGAVARAEELGYSVNVGMAGVGDKLKLLEKGIVDSAILLPSDASSCAELGEKLRKESVPTVFLNPGEPMPFNAVTCDDRGGIELAVRHLESLGHRKIAFLGGPSLHLSYERRLNAFRDLLPGGQTMELAPAIDATMIRDIIAGSDASAYILYFDDIMQPFYGAAASLGLRIPEDLSVIGVNDMLYPLRFIPQPSAIAIPISEMARRSVEMLDETLRSGRPVPSVEFKESLSSRASCAAPPSNNRRIR